MSIVNLLISVVGIVGLLGIVVLVKSMPLKVILAFGWLIIWLWLFPPF